MQVAKWVHVAPHDVSLYMIFSLRTLWRREELDLVWSRYRRGSQSWEGIWGFRERLVFEQKKYKHDPCAWSSMSLCESLLTLNDISLTSQINVSFNIWKEQVATFVLSLARETLVCSTFSLSLAITDSLHTLTEGWNACLFTKGTDVNNK